MKQVGIKIENKGVYHYYYSAVSVEEELCELVKCLEEGMAIEIKCGREHHYIDYDVDCANDPDNDFYMGYAYEINRVMYYVREYLGTRF